ncbi:MAG: T9SS type A sorting domain-containing protein, partial [Bacteroidota bacterium]
TQGVNSTLNYSGSTITITTLNATANPNTVDYNSGVAQTARGTTYHHLMASNAGTTTMGAAATVNGDITVNGGTLADGGFQITGNATGLFTMAAGTTLTLGTAATATAFPTNYTAPNISLNLTNTVNYNSNQAQTISSVPTYGNLTLTATAAVTKTADSDITVNGNLINGANNTFADAGNTITVKGNVTNTGTHSGAGKIYLNAGSAAHTLAGTGGYSNVELDDAQNASINANTTINEDLTITTGTFTVGAFNLTVSGSALVNGTLSITSAAGTKIFNDITVNGTWSNTANEAITINGDLINNGTYTAGTGVYTLTGAGMSISGTAASTTFTTLTVNGTYTNNSTVYVTTLNGAGTWTQGAGSYLYIAGNASVATLDAGTNTNTVDYTSAGAQTINGGTYWHLTNSNAGTSTLGGAITLNGNLSVTGGTLASSTYQITGNATGNFTMAAGTILTLGLTTNITTVDFPTNFITANITLDPTSTVTYQTNADQNISAVPGYGNLILTTGAAISNKTLTGTPLNISGNLTISVANATLDISGNTVNLTGNLTGAGGFSCSTGTLNISGNNTQTGTFSDGTGTVNYLGSLDPQTIRGTTYYDLTVNKTTGTTANMAAATIIDNDFTTSSGTITSTNSISVSGTTSISGTLNMNATGAKTFEDIIVNAGGIWNVTAAEGFAINGNIQNDGTFNANTGTYTLTGAGKIISGINLLAFTTLTITGSYTNSNDVSVTVTTLNGAGQITQGNNSYIYIIGSATVTTFDAGTNINTVEYNGAGAQTVNAGTYYDLTISNANTKTSGGNAIVNNNFIINTGVTFSPAAFDFTVDGSTSIYGTFGDGTLGGISNLQYTELNGGTINGGANGVVNILDDLDIINGNATIGRVSLTVSGSTTVGSGRTLTLNNNLGVITFSGAVTNDGTWVSTLITTAGNLIFQNGITNNGVSFSAGGATFNTNDQDITGTISLSFANNVDVSVITVTNYTTFSVGIDLTGTGSWTQTVNSTLNIGDDAAITGMTAAANPNTVNYNGTAGGSDIKLTTYHNLYVSKTGGGAAWFTGSTTVNSDFIMYGGTTYSDNTVAGYSHNVLGSWQILGSSYDFNTNGTSITANSFVMNNGSVVNGVAPGDVANIITTFTTTGGANIIGACTFTVGTTTSIDGSITFNNNSGVKTFTEAVSINPGGSWTSTSITTTGNLVFKNGISSNGTSFAAGGATFNTNDQSVSGSTTLNFANTVTVTSVTVDNNTTVTMTSTAAGTMTGTGSWTQGLNSNLNYFGSTITISSLNASATGNTIDYYRNNGAQTIFNTAGGTYFNLTLSNTSGVQQTKTLSANADVDGNLTISGLAVLSVSTFDMTVAGNWNNSSTAADPFTQGTRTVTFDGASAQNIFNTGNANGTVFNNVTINNSSLNGVTLVAPTNVNSAFTLTNGLLNTDATNLLTLIDNATSTSGTSSSYVNGPMKKIGNDAFIFPVGKGGYWARIGISAPATATTEFTAEYFSSAYSSLTPVTSPLTDVSTVEYWTLDRAVTADNVNITLYWEDNIRSQINILQSAQLVVARWTGADWVSEGQSGVSAGPAGNISSNVASTFGTFTFGDIGGNPGGGLPVELLSFTAEVINNTIELQWETASETNNDFFTVENSKDAMNFETVTFVNGAGNSNELVQYSAKDYEPFHGISYYRLKQTDFDGQYTYSDVVPVNYIIENSTSIIWYQEGSSLNLNINSSFSGEGIIEIYDYSGKLVMSKNISLTNSQMNISINTGILKPGFYIIRLAVGSEQKTIKVLIY